ncbi:MAG: hypothetical protein COA58_15320 [Bacteroidetes bacterium]|nr:MAG: hypothetical protein COA58_15320 [Bacteroidota bacterium]
MKNSYILFLISTLIFLSNCKSESEEPVTKNSNPPIDIVDPDGIVGTWNWAGTNLGFTGKVIAPETEGYTSQLSLKWDGTYIRYVDFIESSEGTYRLMDTVMRYGRVTLIRYNNGGYWVCQQISLDSNSSTLSFGGQCPDYGGMWYNRME